MTVTRKQEIKWHHRPFKTIIDTSFKNPPIYDRYPMRPYEYLYSRHSYKQYITDEMFDLLINSTNIYVMLSDTLGFKMTSLGEIRTRLHLATRVIKMPRVSISWEAGMGIGIFPHHVS